MYERSLHFRHISKKIPKEEIALAFQEFNIESVNITLDNAGKSRGWGIIIFVNTEERNRASRTVITLRGKTLKTVLCK